MTTCVNCSNEALYTYVMTAEQKINYCDSCIPRFLSSKKDAGQLPLLNDVVVEAPVAEEPAKSSKKKAAPADAEVEPEATDADN